MSGWREDRERRVKEMYQRLRTERHDLFERCVQIATVVAHELTQSPERIERLPVMVEEAVVSIVCQALDAAGGGG